MYVRYVHEEKSLTWGEDAHIFWHKPVVQSPDFSSGGRIPFREGMAMGFPFSSAYREGIAKNQWRIIRIFMGFLDEVHLSESPLFLNDEATFLHKINTRNIWILDAFLSKTSRPGWMKLQYTKLSYVIYFIVLSRNSYSFKMFQVSLLISPIYCHCHVFAIRLAVCLGIFSPGLLKSDPKHRANSRNSRTNHRNSIRAIGCCTTSQATHQICPMLGCTKNTICYWLTVCELENGHWNSEFSH